MLKTLRVVLLSIPPMILAAAELVPLRDKPAPVVPYCGGVPGAGGLFVPCAGVRVPDVEI